MDNSVIMAELLNTLQSIDGTLKRIEQEMKLFHQTVPITIDRKSIDEIIHESRN